MKFMKEDEKELNKLPEGFNQSSFSKQLIIHLIIILGVMSLTYLII